MKQLQKGSACVWVLFGPEAPALVARALSCAPLPLPSGNGSGPHDNLPDGAHVTHSSTYRILVWLELGIVNSAKLLALSLSVRPSLA